MDITSRFFQLTQNGLIQYQQYTLNCLIYTDIIQQKGTRKNPNQFQKVFFDPEMFKDALQFARSNQNILSIVYDNSSKTIPNLVGVKNLKFVYALQNQSSAIAGYYCYLLQQKYPDIYKNQVGVLFGEKNILALDDFYVGFQFGYSYLDKSKISDVILCPQITTFTNIQIAYDVTKNFISNNPHMGILFPLNGSAYIGSYNSIQQENLYAIGVDDDYFNYIYNFNPTLAYIVIGSVIKYMNQLMFKYLSSNPNINTQRNTFYSLKDGVVDFVISPFINDDDIRLQVKEFQEKIESGQIIVPSVL